jgi:hypothetical protein
MIPCRFGYIRDSLGKPTGVFWVFPDGFLRPTGMKNVPVGFIKTDGNVQIRQEKPQLW